MRKRTDRSSIMLLLGAIVIILLPLIIKDGYTIHLAVFSAIAIILATGQNVITGYAGQISVAQAGFYAIGAYSSALLTLRLGLNFWQAMPIAIIITALFGLALGIPSLRLRGVFLAVVTLAFGEIVNVTLLNMSFLTRGPLGLSKIPPPPGFRLFDYTVDFTNKAIYFYLAGFLALLLLVFVQRLIHSRVGRAIIALREDEDAAEAMGVNPFHYKLLAFTLCAAMAGLAGSLYAHYVLYISPDTFVFEYSVFILSMVVLGGLGTIGGPVLGAILITLAPEYLRFVKDYRMIIFSTILLLIVTCFRQGLMGGITAIYRQCRVWFKKVAQIKLSGERR